MALVKRSARLLGLVSAFLLCVVGVVFFSSDSLLSLESLTSTNVRPDRRLYLDKLRSPPPERPPYGAVVAAAQNDTDLSWMVSLEQKCVVASKCAIVGCMGPTADVCSWTMYPYNVDNPDNADRRLRLPMAKGHEAMVYLTYIIDNYDSLPWCTVFVHGHRDAWHQEDSIDRLLSNLNRTTLAEAGYVNLRCDWYPSCPAEIRPIEHDAIVWGPGVLRKESEAAIAGNWDQLFPGEKLPPTIASPCCAQFAVTQQTIRQWSLSDYKRMRDWLINTLLVDDVSGRVFEKLWAYIFTGYAVQ